jgi:hypothetical protein
MYALALYLQLLVVVEHADALLPCRPRHSPILPMHLGGFARPGLQHHRLCGAVMRLACRFACSTSCSVTRIKSTLRPEIVPYLCRIYLEWGVHVGTSESSAEFVGPAGSDVERSCTLPNRVHARLAVGPPSIIGQCVPWAKRDVGRHFLCMRARPFFFSDSENSR